MADDKLIFPIGFDLEEGVKEASKEWKSTYQKQLQKAIDDKPLKVKIDFESKGIDTKEFKQWMALSREAEKLERERIKNAREWDKIANQQAMAETRRANATNESNARIERQNRRAEASERRKRDAVERTNEAYKRQGGYLQRLFQRIVVYASVAQAFSFVRNVRDVTAQFELQRVALGSIIGDLNEANAMFEQIKAAAVKSPFQIKELVTYTKQLAAYKIESDELFETTQRLADISAGLGVGMERLVLAYGQIRATGYLRASEVRQLTEAGIPIVEELAKKMSQLRGETVSAAEVMGMISERAISFGMVKDVFDDMTSAGGMFYKMQEKQAETLAGQWSNLQDAISIMYEEIGNTEGVNNAMKGMIGLVKSLAENWQLLGNILKITAYQYGAMYAVSLFIPRLVQSTKLLRMAEEAHAKAKKMSNVATQRGSAIMAFSAKQTRIYAYWMRQAANAHTVFGRGVKRLAAMFLGGGWIGAVIGVLTVAVSWFISARKEAKRLNEELAKIGTEGALQADQSVRNFERLAKTIRKSADGSLEQSEALAELKRTYGDLLPTQDKEILALVKVKEGYEDVTNAIREKINAQIYEQKMNTIISEYGEDLANKQIKPKKWLENMGFSAEETTRIFNAIDKAVQEGLIKVEDDVVTQARKIEQIIRDQTGKVVNLTKTRQTTRVVGNNQIVYTSEKATRLAKKLSDLVEVYSDFNSSVNELADSQKRASNITWDYQEGYDKLKDSIAKTNAKFNENTFTGSESIKANTLEEWRKYFVSLSNIFADTKAGGIIDFKALEDKIEALPANLRAHIRVVQKEYEKLIPTDITRIANNKLQEYADKVGISMDEVKEHLKTNEQSTEDWANGLKGSYESAEKKLAEYKLIRDNAVGIGKKTHWSKEVEKVEDEMKVLKLLMDFFKEFLKGGDTKQRKSQLSILQEELQLHEKIYAKYKEYRKYMSAEKAKAKVEDYFGDTIDALKFKPSFDKSGYKNVLTQYQGAIKALLAKAKDETERGAIKKVLLDLGFKIGDIDWDDEKDKLEKSLKDLSDKISRTKTAKEFFDRMLGMTGDKELSATLTLSVYGTTGDDLQKLMTKQVEEAFKNLPKGFDISKAILGDGKFDYNILESLIEKLPKDQRQNAQSIVDNWRKANADILTDLQKSYEDFMTYEERKTRVVERELANRKKIEESQYTRDEKDKLLRASLEAEKKELGAIAIEEFKASPDWAKSFEDLEHLATPTIERLMLKLKEFIDTQKDLTPEQVKTLTNEYEKLYDGLIARNPFQALTDGIKEYQRARDEVRTAGIGVETAKANVEATKEELRIASERKEKAMQNFRTSTDIEGAAREFRDAIKQYHQATENASKAEKALTDAKRGQTDAMDKQRQAYSKIEESLDGIQNKFSQAKQLIQSFTETLGISEDSDFGAFLNGISDALGGVSKALAFAQLAVQLFDGTIKSFLASNPIGWILLVVSAIISAVQVITNIRVNNINEDIELLQDHLDNLEYSFGRLQKAQEKAFGTDYISNYENRLANLQAQQEAYLKQADKERSKGKKADEKKIKEYEKQARDTADAIKDMQGELSEYFLGTDLTSAARDFANAWIDAYKEFGSTTDAMKDKFQDVIQNMIVESFAARVIASALEDVFNEIDKSMSDGIFDMSEATNVANMTDQAVGNIDVGMTNLMNALSAAGISVRGMGSNLTGISRDIATASEESILGLAAGINTQNFYISQVPTKLDTIIGLLRGDGAMPQGSAMTLQDVMIAQNQFLSHLPTIAQHTAETVAECKQIVAETRRTADALERVIKPDGTRTTYKMNVVTSYQG